jgi:hypothetical protein
MAQPKEAVIANGLSFNFNSCAKAMGFASAPDCKQVILTKGFLEPWSAFRDGLPLNQTNAAKFDTIQDPSNLIEDCVTETYQCMDSMASCKFDKIFDREGWNMRDYLLCFIYHTSRNMARVVEPWAEAFDRKVVRNQGGRAKAMDRIRGLVRLALYLIHCYTGINPSDVVMDIERAWPSSNPENSPIKMIRREHELNNMDIAQLRRVVVGMLKGNHDEREWLKEVVLLKEGFKKGVAGATGPKAATAAVGEKGEKATTDAEKAVDAKKRKREGEEVTFVASKSVKRG